MNEPMMQQESVHPRLGERLIDRGLLSPRDLERALAAQREMGGYIGQVLVRLGLVG